MRSSLEFGLCLVALVVAGCNAATEAELRSLGAELASRHRDRDGGGHPVPPPTCAIPAICMPCPDGTCASTIFPDGTCESAELVCRDPVVEPTPEFCTSVYDPVCGSDGITYGNACEAHAAGAEVITSGECTDLVPPVPPECPIPAICRVCEDGSCGAAVFPDGTCESLDLVCPED